MADYKALLRQAIRALPENNAASRQAVYEQTRVSLVSQCAPSILRFRSAR